LPKVCFSSVLSLSVLLRSDWPVSWVHGCSTADISEMGT
jgi:hypothetical protein